MSDSAEKDPHGADCMCPWCASERATYCALSSSGEHPNHRIPGCPAPENDTQEEFKSEVVRARALLTSIIAHYEAAMGQVNWQEHARGLRSILAEFPTVDDVDDTTPTPPAED